MTVEITTLQHLKVDKTEESNAQLKNTIGKETKWYAMSSVIILRSKWQWKLQLYSNDDWKEESNAQEVPNVNLTSR